MSEIARLNSHFVQTAASLEYDGAVAQDLARRPSWAHVRIYALEAAVMARPRGDDISVGYTRLRPWWCLWSAREISAAFIMTSPGPLRGGQGGR